MRSSDDLSTVLSGMGGLRPDALHVFAVNIVEQLGIAESGARQGIPVFCTFRDTFDTGALMTYGPDFVELWRGEPQRTSTKSSRVLSPPSFRSSSPRNSSFWSI
jgi:hypothetical protein